jgi:hypothetical protein
MSLPDNLLQKLETAEDLNSAMAEAQVLMAGTTGPVAGTGAEAAEESTSAVLTAEQTACIAAIEAAIEAKSAVDDPNSMVMTTTETNYTNDTESTRAPTAPTETQQPIDTHKPAETAAYIEPQPPTETEATSEAERPIANAAENPLNVALVRAERSFAEFEEVGCIGDVTFSLFTTFFSSSSKIFFFVILGNRPR